MDCHWSRGICILVRNELADWLATYFGNMSNCLSLTSSSSSSAPYFSDVSGFFVRQSWIDCKRYPYPYSSRARKLFRFFMRRKLTFFLMLVVWPHWRTHRGRFNTTVRRWWLRLRLSYMTWQDYASLQSSLIYCLLLIGNDVIYSKRLLKEASRLQ